MLVPFFPKAENLEQSQWRRPFAEAGLGNGRAMSSVMHEAPGSFSGCGSSSLCCSDVSWLLAQNQRNQSRGEAGTENLTIYTFGSVDAWIEGKKPTQTQHVKSITNLLRQKIQIWETVWELRGYNPQPPPSQPGHWHARKHVLSRHWHGPRAGPLTACSTVSGTLDFTKGLLSKQALTVGATLLVLLLTILHTLRT